MPKINQEEYEVLKGLDDNKWKWIARNYNGALITYTDKPMKNPSLYWDDFGERMDDRLFQFVQWTDEEPYEIAELIEEYEIETGMRYDFGKIKVVDIDTSKLATRNGYIYVKESEETEVKKDLNWLKSAIQQNLDFYNDKDEEWQMAKVRAYTKSLDLINQLDEPEVLSQEWLDENKSSWTKLKIDGYYIPVEKLQNLLVPKQIKPKELYKAIIGISPFIEEVYDSSGTETFLDKSVSVERIVEAVMEAVGPSEPEKPVIPKFVADWIESRKNNYPSDVIGVYLRMNEPFANEQTREVLRWVHESKLNRGSFARAWLDGYEVAEEQEPRYYAKIKGHENIASNDKYWNYNTDMEEISVGDSEVHPNVISEYMLKATKDEWANLGITDDNADFELVEEMEE